MESSQGGDPGPLTGRWWQLPQRLQRRTEAKVSRETEAALCRAFAASSLLEVQVCGLQGFWVPPQALEVIA